MKEKEGEIKKEKIDKHLKIKSEKEKAVEKKKRQEMIFLGRIQNCYKQEKEVKERTREENERKIEELVKMEEKLMEQLKNTK